MRVTLPVAMSISMAGRTVHEFGSSNGKTMQKSDGLPSPERSGSPDLKARSSQWKRDRLAYASKEDAHQIDEWPEPHIRKSEDVIVRYKDTRGSKGLGAKMDPHVWSDLPTDTDDEVAGNATSPAWNGAHDGFSPKSGSKTGISRQPTPTASQANHWGAALDGVPRQEAGAIPGVEEERGVATLQDDPSSPNRAAEAEYNGTGPERVPTLRNIPGRFRYMKSPPRAPTSQKSAPLDEQATMKMSHRYYTSGGDSIRRRSTLSRVAVKGSAEDDKHRNRKGKGKSETILQAEYKSRVTHRGAEVDSVKDLTESSSTTLDSDCSDAECNKGSALCEEEEVEEEDAEQSFRQMVLQKYLVALPGNTKKMQSRATASKDKEGRRKSPGTSQTKIWSESASDHRYKSLLPSRSSPLQIQVQGPKKKPCPREAPHTRPAARQTVSQPVLQKEQAPPREQGKKNSLVLLLRKSWSLGDLHHSKNPHLGDICTLNGRPLTHREFLDMENSLTEQEKRAIELQLKRSAKVAKLSVREESQEIKTSDHDQGSEICPPGQNKFAYMGIRSVEISTVTDLPSMKTSEDQDKAGSEFRCDCFPAAVLSKAQDVSEVTGAEHQGQGVSAPALFPRTAEDSDTSLKWSTNDASTSVDGSGGDRIEEREVKLLGKGSSNGGSNHQTKPGNGADETRNANLSQQKLRMIDKVPAVVPFGSFEGGDQVLPDVSLASPTVLELQHEVESKQHAADERRQQVSKQRLIEQRCGTEMQRRGFWDSSQELQKEKQALVKRLQELEVHHPCNRLKAMSGTKVQALTEEDAKKLRQEILEQEALIRGYQVENEKAVAKLKEVQLETKQKLQEMAEEKAHLASQLANRQMQSYGTDSASLHEKLQGALSRETALRIDLDKMRDSYSELEKRVKREESSRMKDLELKLAALHETLEAERESHAQMEGRKQAMIQQEELIASLQETISDQASKIRELSMKLERGGEGQWGISGLEKQDGNESQREIETLQNQVKRLEQSLRAAKKETGLHALQVAKSGVEENETFRRMQAELVAVQRHAQQSEEASYRTIRHLKIENEKIRNESVTRIRNLKQQIQTRAHSAPSISESELSALNRVKDLEKQVANLRIHYSRKVKDLSDKLEEASKPKLEEVLGRNKTSTDSMGPPSRVATTRLIQPAQGKALREAKERITLQEDVISQKDRTIKSLQTQLQAMESNRAGLDVTHCPAPSPVPSIVQGEKHAKPGAQELYCSKTSEQEPMDLRIKGTCVRTATNIVPGSDTNAADAVAVLRRELEKSELTREVLQKACNESVEKAVLLTLQHQQALQIRQSQIRHYHTSECQTVPLAGWGDHRSSGLEGMNWLSERSPSEIANRAMEARLKVMSEELEEANSMCQQSPRMKQIMNLKKKVAEMEVRQQQKEMEWQKILQETKQTSSIEQEYAERKWREALNSKSLEVEKIRLELNAIIEATMALGQGQLQMDQNS